MGKVKIFVYEAPLATATHRVVEVEADGRLTVAAAVIKAVDLQEISSESGELLQHAVVVLNGLPIKGSRADALWQPLKDTDLVHVAPATPMGLDPGTWVLIAISLASAAASYLLAPKIRSGDAENPTDGDRRFAFGRYSRAGARGEPIPVVLGEHEKYGPVKVVAVPGEGEDGDSVLRLLFVIAGHEVESIGTRTYADGDADRLQPGTGTARISGIFFNDQPIENYPDCRVFVRFGTSGQAFIPGFKDTQIPRDVAAGAGGSLMANTSGSDRSGGDDAEAISYTSVDPVDAVVLRVRFAAGLFRVSSRGQVVARSVQYRYRWRVSDGGGGPGAWSAWTEKTVERADQSEFVVAPRLDGLGGVGVDVQVQRVTKEFNDLNIVDEMRLLQVVEVQYATNLYEGCSLLGLVLKAGEQLTSEPRVSVKVKGYNKARIWDGVSDPATPTFAEGYTNNPAYLLLATLTDPALRGEGATMDDSAIDIPSVLEAAARCDELVARPTGSGGGTRRRHTCNLLLLDRRSVQDVLVEIARCMWAVVAIGERIRVIQDRPRTTPVEIFTDGSIAVLEGGLRSFASTYAVTKGGTLAPNQLVLQFENARLGGETDAITYPAAGDLWLADEPVNPVQEKLVGVTDPDEAMAWCVYQMKLRRLRDRSQTFTTTMPWIRCQVFDRIDVACSVAGYAVASGRLARASSDLGGAAVVLDRDLLISDGLSYVIGVRHVDDAVETSPISLAPGLYTAGTAISLDAPLVDVPEFGSEYFVTYAGSLLAPRQVTRQRRLDRDAGGASGGLWEISVVPYDPAVYDPTPADVAAVNYSTINAERQAPGPVRFLRLQERPLNGSEATIISLSWGQEPADRVNTASFRLYRRSVGTTYWQLVPGISAGLTGADLTISDPDVAFEFRVVAVSPLGYALSVYDDRHPTAAVRLGLSEPPPAAPGSLTITQESGNVYRLDWPAVDGASGYQVLAGGDTGTGFPNDGAEDCLVLARTVSNELAGLYLPPGVACRFYVRSVGAGGRLSFTAATAAIADPDLPAGKSIKDAYAADMETTGTYSSSLWMGGGYLGFDGGGLSACSWESPAVDTGSLTATELVFRLATASRPYEVPIDDPGLEAMAIPSIEADQWGVVEGSGATAVVGLLMPPYPDGEHGFAVKIATSSDGTTYTDFETVPTGGRLVRTLRYYKVKIEMTRREAGPYAGAVRAMDVVAIH